MYLGYMQICFSNTEINRLQEIQPTNILNQLSCYAPPLLRSRASKMWKNCSKISILGRYRLYPFHTYAGSSRFYNCREPQKTANIRPGRPRNNRIDRDQNVNLPQDKCSLQPRQKYSQNRSKPRFDRVMPGFQHYVSGHSFI